MSSHKDFTSQEIIWLETIFKFLTRKNEGQETLTLTYADAYKICSENITSYIGLKTSQSNSHPAMWLAPTLLRLTNWNTIIFEKNKITFTRIRKVSGDR